MTRVGQKIKMTSLDELLCVPSVEGTKDIEIALISQFKGHPFKVTDDSGSFTFVYSRQCFLRILKVSSLTPRRISQSDRRVWRSNIFSAIFLPSLVKVI